MMAASKPRPWAEVVKDFQQVAKPVRGEDEARQFEPRPSLKTFPGSNKLIPDIAAPVKKIKSDPADVAPDTGWRAMGKTYMVNGQPTVLYPVGALAAALNRSANTIRSWERKGFLPKPPLRGKQMGHGGKRRLYTTEQIERLILIAYEEGILNPSSRMDEKGQERTDFPTIKYTRFADRVKAFFAEQSQELRNG